MKVKKVIFHNFMPFKGKQEIEFPQHETQNVMLLFGDNMRGKTSFLNAIRWGFYGVALGRHLREIPRLHLVNRDAVDEGDCRMSVTLYFDHEGRNYQLDRRIERLENVSRPKNNADFKEVIGLRIDGTPITGDAINNEINQVMPREISRFFLFDGELLQEYENLLIEKSEQGKKIKEHIESILGVPALVHARDELQVLLKDARAAQRKDAQKDKELRKFAQDQQNHEIELESIENDLQKLNSQKEDFQEKIDALDDFLNDTEAVQKKKIELARLDENQKSLEDDIEQANENTQKLLKTVWKDVLANCVQSIVVNLKKERKRQEQIRDEAINLQGEINELQKSLDNRVCKTCGQNLSDNIRLSLKKRLDELQAKQLEKNSDFDVLPELNKTIENLEGIRSEGEVNRIVDNQSKITKTNVDLVSVESKREEINEEIKDFDTDEIMRKRDERLRLLKLLTRVEEEIKDKEDRKGKNNQAQAKISQLIAKLGGLQSSVSNQRVDRLQQLQTIFSKGIDQLRLKLKDGVEAHATKAFKQITTEKTYSGLQINENYGLSILDKERRIIDERSAGAEQVVALSLIDGLNKTSRTKAPIVMDTPLGRLDPRHRKNILKFLPDMSDQVVLLVHEGEIHAKRDTEVFASRIGARYEINRVSATQS
ncbi:MAG: hypothetical protein OXM61_03275, partial [Candidatus Poribacteria bacterium]|nr:hypothetical protein [Candidatus Poribacteria bacterium]